VCPSEGERQRDREILRICAYSSEFRERWWHCYFVTEKTSKRRSIVELWELVWKVASGGFLKQKTDSEALGESKAKREREREREQREEGIDR
jgi:hypothetical protein